MTPAESFLTKIHEYGARINAPKAQLPGLMQPPHEGLWIEVDEQALFYRLMYTERGTVDSVVASADPLEVLEQIFSIVTFSMATSYEVRHRIEGQDSRRQWFLLQENLMRQLKPEWGDNEARRHAATLKTAPFVDE